ncbi:MAG: ABC transporter permease [Bryobacteraceae bacterium]
MSALLHDLRLSLASLLRQRTFTLAAASALALGIGGTTLMFSVLKAIVLTPPPFPQPGRIAFLFSAQQQIGLEKAGASMPDYTDWKRLSKSFVEMGAGTVTNISLTSDADPERLSAQRVSASFLRVIGVEPALGRLFRDEEEIAGRNRVAILSHGLWQRRFGAAPDVIGKTATLNGEAHSIIGVMPKGMEFPEGREIWLPALMTSTDNDARGRRGIAVIGRLREGVSLAQAQQELNSIAEALGREHPRSNLGWRVNAIALPEELVHEVRPLLYALFGAVAFVLLIACANVANLLLARFSWRRRETAIRAALGASRWRLTQQLLIESILLALLGGALGLLPALWGVDFFRAYAQQEGFHSPEWIRIDGIALLFAFGVSLFTGILFGAAPSLISSHADLQGALKQGERGSSRDTGWVRSALVVSEIALAMMLLFGAGLMLESFSRMRQVDPGFRSERVMTMQLSLPARKYATDTARADFTASLVDRVRHTPGVETAAVTSVLPLSGDDHGRGVFVAGRPAPTPGDVPVGYYRVVTPDYLKTMGIALRRGRFTDESDTEKAEQVVVINQRMAQRLFGSEDPIGKTVRFGRDEKANPPVRIVGVVADVHHRSLRDTATAELYLPYRQYPRQDLVLLVKTVLQPEQITAAIRDHLRQLDPYIPLFEVRPMEKVLAAASNEHKLSAVVFAVFAFVALLLAAVGVYSVMAYLVAQRTAEIGIRIAIGATRNDVLTLVMRQGMPLAVAGIAIGIAGSWALSRVLAGLLFAVSPTEPSVFLKVVICLLAAAALANLIPAWRAARLDPLHALRHD